MSIIKKVEPVSDKIEITWAEEDDVPLSTYHNIWLRDNCHCSQCYYPLTKQRLLNSATIDLGIKAKSINHDGNTVTIIWDNGTGNGNGADADADAEHESQFDAHWLKIHSYNPRLIPLDEKLHGAKTKLAQHLWQVKDIESNLPRVDYTTVMNSSDETDQEQAIKDWSLKLWQYGFCLIDNVPVTPEDTEQLCQQLNYIRPTHYGGFWDFTSDLAKADTAYTNFDISNHTDGTYWSNSPGLQLFHLLYHDGTGGTTSLVDAFKCAEIMRDKFPQSFEVFTRIRVPAHSAGEEKVCIQPDTPQPIFKLDNNDDKSSKIIQVRWNQSDRSTMDSWDDPDDVVKFYQAIKDWVSIITDPENELWYQMRPGQCLIFDNWRVLHSRSEFTGKRRLCGAYLERDDFVSRLKLLTLGRDAVLDAI
ncbi:hypothetical protein CANMA_001995 [Candida margitis]|uniref:uncharacterized protein n=1 Tax=Candida margitis TaxID=1775924 RepID=UPI00222756E7|nr:uncharacterized protein CANMA_001995 [Candida margitis]KAI5968999.1 hypothetical protein CANMA_001995 [Candida margitis]